MTDILDARSGVASGRERPLAGRQAIVTGAALVSANPRARLIDPQELAETALWLCLPAAASVTGQALAIAGGEVM